MNVFISTKTKDPNARNCQMSLVSPCPAVFQFQPLSEGGFGAKDTFGGKIYLCIDYNLATEDTGAATKDKQPEFDAEELA